jgi:hypothetical protein
MLEIRKTAFSLVIVTLCGFVICSRAADAQLRRALREREARINNDGAKAAAVYGASTTPAEKDLNQATRESRQENRQNNWNNKSPNQKAFDYNAASTHHSNVEQTQAAEKSAATNRFDSGAGEAKRATRGGRRRRL